MSANIIFFSLGFFYGLFSLWSTTFKKWLQITKNESNAFNSFLVKGLTSVFSFLLCICSGIVIKARDADLEAKDSIFLQDFAQKKQKEIDSLRDIADSLTLVIAIEEKYHRREFAPIIVHNNNDIGIQSPSSDHQKSSSWNTTLWLYIIRIGGSLLLAILLLLLHRRFIIPLLDVSIFFIKTHKNKLQQFFDRLPRDIHKLFRDKLEELRSIINDILRKNDGIL